MFILNYTNRLAIGGRIDHVWQKGYDKARKIVEKMSIVEKVNLTTGTGWGSGPCIGNTGSVPRLGIPSFCLQDGPNGVRYTDFVTNFPSGIAAGSTFNKELTYLRGKAIGKEHKSKGVHMVLGPVIGPIGMKAAGGRNWESFGADPYLQGILGAATIEGIQDTGVVAIARHFIGNEQEHFRQVGEWDTNGWDQLEESISSNIGDRAMHEVFMWPFADAVRAGVGGIMCSLNQVNNTYACENSFLLNYLLKEELGFQGFVVSDWGAQHSGIYSALAGLDMTMPGEIFDDWLTGKSYWGPLLTKSIYNDTLPQERLNDMVARILVPFFAVENLNLPSEDDTPNFSSWTSHTYGQQYPYQHYGPIIEQNSHVKAKSEFSDDIALNVAREAIVLLKNEGHNLPIDKEDGIYKILIAGLGAGPESKGNSCKDLRCHQGTLTSGWGSAAVSNPFVITPYEAISEKARERGISVNYISETWDFDQIDEVSEIVDLAIMVVTADSGEGFIEVEDNYGDRQNFSLWNNGDELIKHVSQRCKKTIIVVNAVGPVNMENWIENENVVAVLYAGPLGQYAGQAISEVLFGDVNPSGKLPFTIAKKKLHYVPIIDSLKEETSPQDNFDRDIYIDYRFFDKHNIKPRFEFGYGLSYTKFQLSDLQIIEINSPTEYLPYPEDYLPIYRTVEDDVCDPEDALFPHDKFEPVPGYIYPYLYNENVQSLANDESFDYPLGYSINHKKTPPLSAGFGGNQALWEVLFSVKATVKNIGKYKGGFVGQMYIEMPSTVVGSPPRILRGFDKVFVEKDKTEVISFEILHRDLSIWDTESQQWIIQTGTYKVYVGSSSRKMELCGEIDIGA